MHCMQQMLCQLVDTYPNPQIHQNGPCLLLVHQIRNYEQQSQYHTDQALPYCSWDVSLVITKHTITIRWHYIVARRSLGAKLYWRILNRLSVLNTSHASSRL